MPVARGRKGVEQEMKKFKSGTLHSGSKRGPVVKSRKQAVAIALSEAGMSKRKKKIHRGQNSTRRGNQHMTSETHAYHY